MLRTSGLILLAVGPCAPTSEPAPAPEPSRAVQDAPQQHPVAPPPRPKERVRAPRINSGVVIAITKDSITIQDGTDPPQQFPVSEILASGKFPAKVPDNCTYRLSDVRVGDKISIMVAQLEEADVCECVCIHRRPGGRVPPAPGERPGSLRPWHEWKNAEQDFEEKGIPLPAKYDIKKMRPGSINGIPIPRELIPAIPPNIRVNPPAADPKPPMPPPDRKQTDN